MLQYLQYGMASTESFSFLNFVSVELQKPNWMEDKRLIAYSGTDGSKKDVRCVKFHC